MHLPTIDAIATMIPKPAAELPKAATTASTRAPGSPPVIKLMTIAEMISAKKAFIFNPMIIPRTMTIPTISVNIAQVSFAEFETADCANR
jgi:hypothetical protein